MCHLFLLSASSSSFISLYVFLAHCVYASNSPYLSWDLLPSCRLNIVLEETLGKQGADEVVTALIAEMWDLYGIKKVGFIGHKELGLLKDKKFKDFKIPYHLGVSKGRKISLVEQIWDFICCFVITRKYPSFLYRVYNFAKLTCCRSEPVNCHSFQHNSNK